MAEGQKNFRKRNAILACLRGTKEHPSADMVYNAVREENPDISLATVYRNLAYFVERGDAICVGKAIVIGALMPPLVRILRERVFNTT